MALPHYAGSKSAEGLQPAGYVSVSADYRAVPAPIAYDDAIAYLQANAEYYPFSEIMAMKMMDKDKDGMVSKKEYMDMMAKAWDMNAQKMGVKGEKMTKAQFDEVLMYLKAGG